MKQPGPFICVLCKKEHPCVEPKKQTISEEEMDKLRQAWHKSIELLDAEPDNKGLIARELRASIAYFSQKGSDAWSFPTATATTRGGNGKGWEVICFPECSKNGSLREQGLK